MWLFLQYEVYYKLHIWLNKLLHLEWDFYFLFLFTFYLLYQPGHWPNKYSVHHWSGKPGFNPRSSHTKDSKMILDSALLNTQHYKVKIKVKWNNSSKGVAPSPTSRCNSYWKGDLQDTLDCDHQLYLLISFIVFDVLFMILSKFLVIEFVGSMVILVLLFFVLLVLLLYIL